MNRSELFYAGIMLVAVFIGAVSQTLLKKAALQQYTSRIKEYLNPRVIIAYVLFWGTTLLNMCAYKGVPLSMGPILESTSYIYVTVFSVVMFHEKLNRKKLLALASILLGICLYSL